MKKYPNYVGDKRFTKLTVEDQFLCELRDSEE